MVGKGGMGSRRDGKVKSHNQAKTESRRQKKIRRWRKRKEEKQDGRWEGET